MMMYEIVNYFGWLNGSNLQHSEKVDLLKIVIDKGLFAVVIAFAGLVFALILERAKLNYKKKEEYAKITLPLVMSLIGRSEQLFKNGLKTVDQLDNSMDDYRLWAQKISDSPYHLRTQDVKIIPSYKDFINAEVICKDGPPMSFYDFATVSCPNSLLREKIIKSNVLHCKDLYEPGMFGSLLFTIMLPSMRGRRNELLPALQYRALADIFTSVVKDPREKYLKEVESFYYYLMSVLPIEGNKKQKKAVGKIFEIIKNASTFIETYPKGYLVSIEGRQKPPSGKEVLLTIYGALISQIRIISINI